MNQIENLIIKTENIKWKSLRPFQPESLKKTSPDRLQKLKTSLLSNGFAMSFYVFEDQEGNIWIIDGHHRLKALEELEQDGKDIPIEFPCSFLRVRDKAHAKKLVLAFNSHYAELQKDGLLDFIDDLDFDDVKNEFEFFDLGFDLPDNQEEVEEEEPPEVPETPASQLGDLYELNGHRILCGDCTDEETVSRLMDGEKADMVFTDPPYGVEYSKKNAMLNSLDGGNRIEKEIEDDSLGGELKEMLKIAFTLIESSLKDTASFYVCSAQGGDMMMMMMIDCMTEGGLSYRHMLVWVKNNHVLGRCDYNYKHEPILYGWKKSHKFYGNGEHKTSVWAIDKPHKSKLHPTMKPVKLIVNAILNSTDGNSIVIDTFLGSGSTLIACEQTNRICYGLEIDPQYIDVIVQRWVNFTGIETIKKNGEEITWKVDKPE